LDKPLAAAGGVKRHAAPRILLSEVTDTKIAPKKPSFPMK
jgi:hypothetical protein